MPRVSKGGFRKATAQYEKGHGQSRFNPSGLLFLHVIIIPKVVFSFLFPPGYKFSKNIGAPGQVISAKPILHPHAFMIPISIKRTNRYCLNHIRLGNTLWHRIYDTHNEFTRSGVFLFSWGPPNIEQT